MRISDWSSDVCSSDLSAENRSLIGYDQHSDQVRRAAMRRAIATGMPQATGPVIRKRGSGGRQEIVSLIYAPVFGATRRGRGEASEKSGFRGFVHATHRIENLATAELGMEKVIRVDRDI